MKTLINQHYYVINRIIIGVSALLCLLLPFVHLPGLELLGITANWSLLWVVSWSLKRTIFQSAIAGLTMGLMEDSLTGVEPSHVISLGAIAVITATLSQKRYIPDKIIFGVLWVFFMAMVAESFTALQFLITGWRSPLSVWQDYQKIVLTRAILSSLWMPVLYYPLKVWWHNQGKLSGRKLRF